MIGSAWCLRALGFVRESGPAVFNELVDGVSPVWATWYSVSAGLLITALEDGTTMTLVLLISGRCGALATGLLGRHLHRPIVLHVNADVFIL